MMIELLAEQLVLSWKKPLFRSYTYAGSRAGENGLNLVKPLTYMNRSGEVLPSLLRRRNVDPSGVIVVTDNMDLPAGRVRMKPRGSSAGHNGIKSVMAALGSGDFYRLYVGVGRPEAGVSVVDHVLGEFSPEDRIKVDAAIHRCAGLLVSLRSASPAQVMNEINAGNI